MAADRPAPGARLARRQFLGALAVAPAALAGCAAAGASGPHAPADQGGEPHAGSAPLGAAAADAAAHAVREQPLPVEAEPAFTFRAAAVRPGGR